MLNKDGVIAAQGTYSALRESDAYVASLDVRFKQTTNESVDQPIEALGQYSRDNDTYLRLFIDAERARCAPMATTIGLAILQQVDDYKLVTIGVLIKLYEVPRLVTKWAV
jgi:hypothetical protein